MRLPSLSPRLKKRALDAGLIGHDGYTRFLVAGRSRVGSNLLRGLLNAHPEIVAFGEVFRDPSSLDWDHTGYFLSDADGALLRSDPVTLIDSHLFGRYPRAVRAVGFKLFYYHARSGPHAAVWPHLAACGNLRVIHLKRRNLLQTHLSRRRAGLSNRWVDTSGGKDDARADEALFIDPDECLRDFERTRAWEMDCDRLFAGHAMLPVEYERLANDCRREAHAIQEFLGVTPRELAPSTYQQARRPLSAAISNYADLKQRFVGGPWEEFFTE